MMLKKEIFTLTKMLRTTMHLGHKTSEWNPQMKPFIFKKVKDRYIIDIVKSRLYFLIALAFLEKSAKEEKKFIFIGTKKDISLLLPKVAKYCNSYYVNQRWLGGMLTNWKTIQQSIKQLKYFRKAEKTGQWAFLNKREVSRKRAKKLYLEKNLLGIKKMKSLPDIAIILSQPEDINAVKECLNLGIELVTVVDTNCDPRFTDWIIPANDDSLPTMKFILSHIVEAIRSGQSQIESKKKNKKIETVS
jgi:small subunit ribosomal protein S2|uniref:ribosomal protein S2 n=1 Tax=Prototheca lentecrescens TaxID=2836214 RepID=UPI0030037B76